jgi:predicted ferric reductase
VKRTRLNFGLILTFLIPMPLVVAWIIMSPFQNRFLNISTTATSLGQLSGLIGMALFALALILATRLHFLENIYNGLNQVYAKHHQIAAISFILLLIHPLSLVIAYLQYSTQSAALFLLPGAYLPRTYGIIALFGMIALLVITFYLNIRYDIWKFTHKFLGIIFAIALLHVITIPSDFSRNPFIKYYLLALSFLALSGFIYKSVLGRYLVRRYKYQVIDITQIKPGVFEVMLAPSGKKMNFIPSQYIFVKFIDHIIGQEEHPFSISSHPSSKNLTITIKGLGDYTKKISSLTKGTKALIDGPYGRFYSKGRNDKQVWIAGGIGITPFVSMAKDINKFQDVVLYYSTTNTNEALYQTEFSKIAQKSKLRVVQHVSSVSGRLNVKQLTEDLQDFSERDYYICGPPLMIKNIKKQLLQAGINKSNIFTEEFEL